MKYYSLLLAASLLLGSTQTLSAMSMGDLADAASSATGQQKESGLLDSLSSQLGVSPAQASGGAAAILGDATSKLSPSDLGKLTDAVPDIKSITDGASSLSSLAGAAGAASSVADQFSALGLDPAMIGKYTPIIMEYVNKIGGPSAMGILGSVL